MPPADAAGARGARRFDHVGIVVPTLDIGRTDLAGGLDVTRWTEEFDDPINDVLLQFGICPAGVCYELIAPRSAGSPVNRALKSKTSLTNHVAYLVDDLAAERERLEELGWSPIREPQQAVAFGGAEIQFFMCRRGLFFELIEAPHHRHVYRAA